MTHRGTLHEQAVAIQIGHAALEGDLTLMDEPVGLVIFAHGSGSSRRSSRNRFVASSLNDARLATLLFDLLTLDEEQVDQYTRHIRFDIPLLARRLVGVIDWTRQHEPTGVLNIGLFGASTGAAAALIAAAERPDAVGAVVSRGGRPDLAGDALPSVRCPTLLIIGGDDAGVIELNEEAAARMTCEKRTEIVPGASHLFEEPGKLEAVADLAREWFETRLRM